MLMSLEKGLCVPSQSGRTGDGEVEKRINRRKMLERGEGQGGVCVCKRGRERGERQKGQRRLRHGRKGKRSLEKGKRREEGKESKHENCQTVIHTNY